jgi:microsomal dipeptidase-like Zn-dependent dipeptidase
MGTEWIVKPGEETQGMSRPSDMQNLIDSMKRRGFSSDLINGVLGENFFRVFKNTLPDK